MIVERPHFCLARVTLEAMSAHGIHSGRGDTTHDVLLVRDANGLPTLPGSTLAGVLRRAFRERHGAAAAGELFGRPGKDPQASWLTVGWGMVHGVGNKPCEGLRTDIADDPLLSFLQASKPLVRQRVRLEHTGAASDTGKFDVTLIPAGVRYTSWLSYWCDGSEASRQRWQGLLDVLAEQPLRLGHGTRSGNGHFQVGNLLQANWDLRSAEGRKAYVARPRSRRDGAGLTAVQTARPHASLRVSLALQAESGWRVGGGERSLKQHEKTPDLFPQHEIRVRWKDNRAHVGSECHLLPGSAIKGAIRHRVAYHYRCLIGQYAAPDSVADASSCPAVQSLFGFSEASGSDDEGRAGALVFHDLSIDDANTTVLMHNRIDRFTGGVFTGALFSEEVLWKTPLVLHIDVAPLAHIRIEPFARQALQRALEDLAGGWLPLGASGSRGLGVFNDPSGEGPQWSDGGKWIGEAVETEVCA